MSWWTSRRGLLKSVLAAATAVPAGKVASAEKNKRDAMLALLDRNARQDYVPAAFFIHFDEAYHFGSAAVQKHLEYFRYTGMDFVKIQYERTFPPIPDIKRPADWAKVPSYKLDFYEPMLDAGAGARQGGEEGSPGSHDALLAVHVRWPLDQPPAADRASPGES
jgi:hypothetical protein